MAALVASLRVSDEAADAVADALVGPVLPSSPVYRAYCEPVPESTRDMRGCVRLAVAL